MTSGFGIAPRNINNGIYAGSTLYFVPCTEAPRAPTTNDRHYPLFTLWRNRDPAAVLPHFLGDLWYLARFDPNGTSPVLAIWIKLSGGGVGPLLSVTGDDAVITYPDALGNVNLSGSVVAAATHAKPLYIQNNGASAEEWEIQVSRASTAGDINKTGLSYFDSTIFSVDANGFVSLVGGSSPAIQKVNVDTSTAPGTDPVLPDGSGQIIVTGGQTAPASIANVIRTNSLAANTYTIQIQQTSAVAAKDTTKNGVAHFNSAQFSNDEGFISLVADVTPDVFAISNLGFSYSGGTFTVHSADGTALSASNAATLWLVDKTTPCQMKKYTITANQTFTDGNGGSFNGMKFGINASGTDRDWYEDMPFYLYAITDDTEVSIAFAISRNPTAKISPAAASLGKSGAIVNVGQSDMYLLPSITVADYESNPCLNLGSFRMRYTSADTAWLVQTLTASDGIGNYHEETEFLMPKGVQNSNESTWYVAIGATTGPTWADEHYTYTINRDGYVVCNIEQNGCTANGSAAVQFDYVLPYNVVANAGNNSYQGYFINPATTFTYLTSTTINGSAAFTSGIQPSGLAAALVQRNAFSVAQHEIGVILTIKAYNG